MSKITGSEAVIKCLLEEQVDIIYGYPGGAIMPVYDELYKYQDKIHHVLTRHEQGATHSAQGFARISGRVGVAIATSGPGATNLVTGLADAQIDSTPMVCITGQVSSHLLGSDAFQETDIIGISMPVTKWNYQITKASEIPEIFAKAFYIAKSGRPGPVLIDITKDAQFELFEYDYKKCNGIRSYIPYPEVNHDSIDHAVKLINQAKKPLIVWGQGVILGNAEEEFKNFVEKADIYTDSGPKTSYNVGIISGGTSINSIPFKSLMQIDIRSIDPNRLNDMEEILYNSMNEALDEQNAIKRSGPDLKLTINKIGNRPSGKVDESVPLIQKTIAATQYMGIEPRLTIGSTDSNIPISLGLPAVTIGRGGEGGGAHSLDEWWLNKDGYKSIQLALLILLSESGIN